MKTCHGWGNERGGRMLQVKGSGRKVTKTTPRSVASSTIRDHNLGVAKQKAERSGGSLIHRLDG